MVWKRTKQIREDQTANDSASSSRRVRSFAMVAVSLSASLLFRYRTVPNHLQIQTLPNLALPKLGLSFSSWLVAWGWLANTILLSVKISQPAYRATLIYVGRSKHSVSRTLNLQWVFPKTWYCIIQVIGYSSRLKLGNASYHSVQNLLSSSLLSKNLQIKIYRTIIFPVVLYGCETWSLTLR